MNQQKARPCKRREKIQRLDFFAAARGQRRFVLEEKRHVRTERRGQLPAGPAASGRPKSSFMPSSVVAALPLPPPSPAASGIFFSR